MPPDSSPPIKMSFSSIRSTTILETDAVLVEGASVAGADAVDHAGGVEGARDVAGPFLAREQPLEQHGEDLVRIDEVAVFVDGSDTVGIAVGDQAGVASVLDDGVLKSAHVRLDGLRIDAGEERVVLGANLDVVHA